MPQCHVFYLDQINIADIFAKFSINYVLHCATHYGRRDKDPMEIIEANLIYPLQLLILAVRHKVAHFINTDTILDKRVNQYSLSKKQFLDWLLRYKDEINVANIRLEHFYGPGDDDSKFVTRFILDCLNRIPRIPLTKGEQRRDFIYISDVVRAFVLIIEHLKPLKDGYIEYEVGSGCSISIRDFCQLIKSLSCNETTQLDFGAIDYRSNEMMDSQVDISKLATVGWTPFVTLKSGLMSTIEAEKRRFS
jgi:nucleoside-diphosphate-sugar epimerase